MANHVVLTDKSASRNHCVIESNPDGHRLVDLESRNGTFVNGIPVRKRWLEHGDEIRIGNSVFLYLLDGTELGETEEPSSSASGYSHSTQHLRVDEGDYLRRSAKVSGARAQKDLKALLEFSSGVQQLHTRGRLFARMLEVALTTIPAERAAIFLFSDDQQTCTLLASLNRLGRPDPSMALDPQLAAEVIGNKVAVIAEATTIPSIAAAPVLASERPDTVVYVDSSKRVSLETADLQFLTALATIGGLALENVLRLEYLREENSRLRDQVTGTTGLIGESEAMRAVAETIAKVAQRDSTVILTGENGTGKELAARAIHSGSGRADKPFIAVNCASLTDSLLESELFGHEKGAFTGAIALKKGKFELAHTGTIFLDEIGELAPSTQARLLRVLQEREFERVGGIKTIPVNVRVIAATNRDLEAAVRDGTFRQDLFFRLNVISIEMPPLRDRREDIPLLASYFLAKASAKAGRRVLGISEQARAWLLKHDWPGNVRELENAIERAVVLGAADLIMPEDLPEAVLESEPPRQQNAQNYHEALNAAKRDVVQRALQQAGGVQTEAAKLLDIHPVYLHRLIRKLKLK